MLLETLDKRDLDFTAERHKLRQAVVSFCDGHDAAGGNYTEFGEPTYLLLLVKGFGDRSINREGRNAHQEIKPRGRQPWLVMFVIYT